MKRILQHQKAIFALLLAFCLGLGTAYASDFSAVSPSGHTLYYRITDATNHYVELTYPGTLSEPWGGFVQPTGNVTLPSTVTNNGTPYTVKAIGIYAFFRCSGMTGSLTIPNTVTSIGEFAFQVCSGLNGSLNLGNSVTEIGPYAFMDCGFTGSLTLPNTLTSIGEIAFAYCEGFTGSLNIPNSVTSIGEAAFAGCTGLNGTLTIGTGLTSMGASAFKNCSSFTHVNYNAVNCANVNSTAQPFENCTGTITIGNTVQRIPSYMFYQADGLTGSLTIPNSVTTVGSCAFADCNGFTGSLTIGNSVTTIEFGGFGWCPNFTGTLNLGSSLTTIGAQAFYIDYGFTGTLTIPNSVTTIDNYAFDLCSGFTGSLTIPNSVTNVGEGAFLDCSGFNGTLTIGTGVTSIGYQAFKSCTGFTHVEYNATNCNDVALNYNGTYESPFENCGGTLTIGNTVQRIPANLFYQCTGLTGPLTIPNSVTEIGEGAFAYCDGFTGDLTIGKYVTSMGDNAFRDCTGFTHLNYNAIHSADLSSTDHENIPFKNFSGTLSIGDEVQRIPRCMFYDCVGLTGSLTIPSSVTSIGYGAFYRCTHFTSLYLGNSLTTIDVYAFYNCYRMTNALTIPESVTTIDYAAFADCYGFTSLTIGSNVTTIGNNAFSYCGGLGFITVRAETPPTLSTDGSFAFDDVPMDIPVYVPCGSISDYRAANGWSTFTNYQCIPWTVNLSANPWGGGYVDFTDSNGTNGHYSNGTTCTVLATPHDNYLFMHWSKNGTVVSSNPSYSFNVYEDTDLEAVFMALSDAGDIIGESTGTNVYLPSFSFYNYSLTEQIYTADELNGISTITSISFFNEGPTKTRTLSIYLMHTNKAAFSTTTDWISANLSNAAFGGSVTMRSGMWTTITLSRPFVYNGSSNLVLIVDDNTGDYSNSPHMACRTYAADGNQTLRIYSDDINYAPNNLSSYTGTFMQVKNQIMLNRVAYNIDATSADETAGTVSGGGQYGQGDLCSMKATPQMGYTFLDWTDETGLVISTEAEYSFFVTESRTLTAHFLFGTDVCSLTFDLYDSYGDGWNDNYLVADFGDGSSHRLTISSDTESQYSYTLPVVNGNHIELGWIQSNFANECFFKVSYSNGNIAFASVGVDLNANFEYGFDMDCNEMPANWAFLGYDDNGGSDYLPSHSYYNYSMSQQIYIADEIGSEGNITSIAFYNENYGDDDNTKTRTYDIYLKTTNKNEFFTGTDWISVTEDDKVFSGNVTMTSNEWTLITFDKPFVYDGTSNLALIVDDNTGSYTSAPHMSCRTYYYNGDNQAIYAFNDGTNYNPNSPSAYNGTLMNEKNQVYFGFANIDCWPPVNLTATDITTNSATLHWEGYQDSYNLRYRVAPPFFEDFEDEESFSADWTFISMNPTNAIGANDLAAGVISNAFHSGTLGFRFSSFNRATDYNQYLISSQLTMTGDLKFYFKKSNSSTESLYVGYSTTGNDLDDFIWTEDLVPTEEWQEYTQTLPSDVKYIAFHYYGNFTYYVYLDDITIGDNGIPMGNWETVNNVAGTTTEIIDLDPSTNYVWQVQGNNTSCNDNGTTRWSKKATFATECDAIIVDAENPFFEDFESEAFAPDCWDTYSTGSHQWTRNTFKAHSGSASAFSDFYGDVYLVMPDLELSANASSAQLSFWSYDSYPYDFAPGNNSVVLLDGDMETVLWSAETAIQDWTEATIDLSAYMGQTITLAFKYAGDNGNGWYVDDVEVSVEPATTVTQTIALDAGWNWFSTYIELDDPVELLNMLEEGMGDSGIQIENVIDGINMNVGDGYWAGDLDGTGLLNEHMYMIEVSEDITVELQGPATNPESHEITLYPGDFSWIGFPCAEEVDVNVALAGLEAEEGDYIENNELGIIYYYGEWMGDFNTMIPGRGYMYFSNSTQPKTLIFSTTAGGKSVFLRKRKE